MKILHVINRMGIGGAEKLLTELLPLQLQQGHEVAVVRLATGEFDFVKRLEKTGINIVSLGKNENDIYNPLFIFKLSKYIEEYDIIHVHLFPSQYWVALAAILFRSKARLVTTEHNTDNRRRNIRIFKWIDKIIYKRYDAIIAISDKTNKMLSDYLNCKDRIHTVSNGIDISQIVKSKPIERKYLTGIEECTVIVQVARFSEQKDQDTLIRSMNMLPSSYHVFFVGDGIRRKICEKLSEQEGVMDRVHFLGTRNDVFRILKVADIVVMSSHWEGFGLAAVEGMAAGKPVIASDVPGLAEVIGGAGLLFEHENVSMLAEQISSLMMDSKFYRTIACQCALRAKKYDIHTMSEKYEQIYHQITNYHK